MEQLRGPIKLFQLELLEEEQRNAVLLLCPVHVSGCLGGRIRICVVSEASHTCAASGKVCFTWMRHLLTSLAQRALLQPEVRASPDRRRRRAAAAAGRVVRPGLILTAHQHVTGNTYSITQHQQKQWQRGKTWQPTILCHFFAVILHSIWFFWGAFLSFFNMSLAAERVVLCRCGGTTTIKRFCVLRREALLRLHQGVYPRNLKDLHTNKPKSTSTAASCNF